MGVANHQGVLPDPAHHPVGHAADHAVLDRAHAERTHHHQVVVGVVDVIDQAFPVLAVESLVLEGEAGPIAGGFHHVQVRVGNQLQTAGDQRVVDLALPLQLLLVLVFLGQRKFHLLNRTSCIRAA